MESQNMVTKGDTIIDKLENNIALNSDDINYIKQAIRFSELYCDIVFGNKGETNG